MGDEVAVREHTIVAFHL